MKQSIFLTELDRYINPNAACGYFITMSPNYADRQELNDDLSSFFHPVAIILPNFYAIALIILLSMGFFNKKSSQKRSAPSII